MAATNAALHTSSISDSLALSVNDDGRSSLGGAEDGERLWRSFPGRNAFACGGRCMFGADCEQFLPGDPGQQGYCGAGEVCNALLSWSGGLR